MNATDTEFFRAFTGRIRSTLATTPKGGPAVNTATSTTETAETVPASLLSAPASRPARQFVIGSTASEEAPCLRAWCTETGAHVEHVGRLVDLPEVSAQIWQDTDDAQPTIVVGNTQDDYESFTSGRQLRERAAQIRVGSARLDALADEYDAMREAAGQQTAPTGGTWSITTALGVKVEGYLPGWAENDPSLENVPANRLQLQLSDLTFIRDYAGPLMAVNAPSGEGGKYEVYEREVFRAQIWCSPHDADYPEEREPYGIITVLEDCVMDHLGPDDMATVAAQLRARADAIEQAGYDLAAARADWAKNGGTR